MHFDLQTILPAIGLFGILAIVFAESGLLIGFFLPGDSLLFTAGFLAYLGYFNIWVLTIGCFIAAVAGDQVGYAFGKKVGRRLFNRKDSMLFHKENLEKAEKFYEKHGAKTIVLARFLPVVRTFAPIVAGMAHMNYRTFVTYNLIGGLLWAVGLTLLGYFLGQLIPAEIMEKYLYVVILVIIILSVLPTAVHILKDKESRDKLLSFAISVASKPFSKK
jgi:membrane-associated protein